MSELNSRSAVVFVHPTLAFEGRTLPGIRSQILEAPFDTTSVLSRCPDIRFIFAHGGGAIPYLAGRVAALYDRSGEPQHDLFHDQLRRLYFDTALVMNEPAMAALRTFSPRSQLLLGTDSPFLSAEAEIGKWQKIELDPEVRALIERGNANALLRQGQ
jgi:6-methylsalicylate decarboxylase